MQEAWHCQYAVHPSARTLAVLLAHWALETGRGTHMHGHNFAGLKAEAHRANRAWLATVEGTGNRARRVQGCFRTYASAWEGARDYVATLASAYPEAAAAAASGHPGQFVAALEGRRYFTGDPVAYRSAIVQMTQEFSRATPGLSVRAPESLVLGVIHAFRIAMARRG